MSKDLFLASSHTVALGRSDRFAAQRTAWDPQICCQDIDALLQELLQIAILNQASDIHFDPEKESYQIRYRIDGCLWKFVTCTKSLAVRLFTKIKVLSQLDLAQHQPQDGFFQHWISALKQESAFRVSSIRTYLGEKIVLRIVARHGISRTIESLNMDSSLLTLYRAYLMQSQGLVVVAGPTGSGKSTTLFAGLAAVDKLAQNVCTVEDPIEVLLPGLVQIAVQKKAGYSFNQLLRALLRQDPDILMVGEVRDELTASTLATAFKTGHLVLSTLHASSAQGALQRLKQFGFSESVFDLGNILLIAQRLLRTLCGCKRPALASVQLSSSDLIFFPYQPVGCARCHGTGYKGRIAVFEWLMVLSGGRVRASDQTLLGSSLNYLRVGNTSLEELQRVFGAQAVAAEYG